MADPFDEIFRRSDRLEDDLTKCHSDRENLKAINRALLDERNELSRRLQQALLINHTARDHSSAGDAIDTSRVLDPEFEDFELDFIMIQSYLDGGPVRQRVREALSDGSCFFSSVALVLLKRTNEYEVFDPPEKIIKEKGFELRKKTCDLMLENLEPGPNNSGIKNWSKFPQGNPLETWEEYIAKMREQTCWIDEQVVVTCLARVVKCKIFIYEYNRAQNYVSVNVGGSPNSNIFHTPFIDDLGKEIFLAKNPIHYRAVIEK